MKKQHTFWICLFDVNMYINMFILTNGIDLELPNELYELCPYSDICNETASRTYGAGGMVPCCSSCGCDEECGLRLDCCFEHLDKYRLIEKGKVVCMEPTVRYESVENDNSVQKGYLMVQACDNETLDTIKDNERVERCPVMDEDGNSLIAPVSMLDTIYVNKECAACNKVNMTRIKHWNYFFLQSYKVSKEPALAEVENNLKSNFGTVIFLPPPNENWAHKHCYNKYELDKNCLTDNVWQTLCHNLRAPFHVTSFGKRTVYNNVFCLLCTGRQVGDIRKDCISDSIKTGPNTKLTMLINSAVIEAPKLPGLSDVMDIQKRERFCPVSHEEFMKKMCLPINCPEGMLKTNSGCKYYILKWFSAYLVMQIKLVPEEGAWLPVSKLPPHKIPRNRYYCYWFDIPCRQIVTFFELYYSSNSRTINKADGYNATSEYVTSFVMRIWVPEVIQWEGHDPSVAIPILHKCVNETWQATLENETYVFYPYFDKYSGYVQDGEQILKKWPGGNKPRDREYVAKPAIYTPLAAGQTNIDIMSLRKPFFCNNVRVPREDVEIGFGEILIKSKNITLGTNEYIVNMPIVTGGVNKMTFSVCVEDYNHTDIQRSGSTVCTTLLPDTCIGVFLACYLFIEVLFLYI